jgi:hypothetical protein
MLIPCVRDGCRFARVEVVPDWLVGSCGVFSLLSGEGECEGGGAGYPLVQGEALDAGGLDEDHGFHGPAGEVHLADVLTAQCRLGADFAGPWRPDQRVRRVA